MEPVMNWKALTQGCQVMPQWTYKNVTASQSPRQKARVVELWYAWSVLKMVGGQSAWKLQQSGVLSKCPECDYLTK